MSCPSWKRLAAGGPEARESAAWRAALDHLEECDACIDEALAVEPTLLFRRLPTVELRQEEVAAMQQAVASLRRAASVSGAPRRGRRALRWLEAAAVVAVLGAAALLEGTVDLGRSVTAAGATGAPGAVATPATAAFPAAAAAALDLSQTPLVEDPDGTLGPVIQLVDGDLAVVVVVRPGVDV